MDFNDLSEFLNTTSIPIEEESIGFLEIIRKAHNEIINSNLYSYFLSSKDSYVSHAFLLGLLDIIKKRTGTKYNFTKHDVTTELPTEKGRIDIVIKDLIAPTVIIIENKLFHNLYNPLMDYWNHFKIDKSSKIGILLTVKPHPIPDDVKDKFINITHWEWINSVKQYLSFSEIEEDKTKVYLEDFFNTIERLSTTYEMNESAKFFFEHASQINLACESQNEGHKFILEQYELIASKLGLQSYGGDLHWKNFWDENNVIDTYFTLTIDDIIKGDGLNYKIIIEIIREDKTHIEDIIKVFKNHPQFKDKDSGENTDFYSHLLLKDYTISLEQMNNFADYVVDNIKHDFGDLFVRIVGYRYPNKDITVWSQKVCPSV